MRLEASRGVDRRLGECLLARAQDGGPRRVATLDSDTMARLRLYPLDERLIVWEFFHRPEFLGMWHGGTGSFRECFATYERELDEALRR